MIFLQYLLYLIGWIAAGFLVISTYTIAQNIFKLVNDAKNKKQKTIRVNINVVYRFGRIFMIQVMIFLALSGMPILAYLKAQDVKLFFEIAETIFMTLYVYEIYKLHRGLYERYKKQTNLT